MTELVRAQSKYVMQSGIRSIDVERLVQLALLAQDPGGQLVREPAIALGQSGQMAIARGVEWGAGADFPENLEGGAPSGGTGCLNPASPCWGTTALRFHGAACDRRDTRYVRPS